MFNRLRPAVAFTTIVATVATPMPGQGIISDGACCAPVQEYRLECQTVYEEKPYTAYRLETETVLEERTVVSYKPVVETEMRERRYTVTRPIAETSMREERRTVMRPVYETRYREVTYQRTRMVSETSSREERRTVMKPVVETQTREEYRTVQKPVTEVQYQDQPRTAFRPQTEYSQQIVDRGQYYDQWTFKPSTERERNRLQLLPRRWYQNQETGAVASQRPGAYWVPQEVDQAKGQYKVQRVYVPQPVPQQVATTTMVPYQYTEKVAVPVTRIESETQVRRVPVQVTRYVQEEQVRRVPVTVQRPVTEQKVEQIPYQVVRWVPQEQRREVPVTTYKYVSEERVEQIPIERRRMVAEYSKVEVPKKVSKWVATTRVRRIPRTMVMRIPIDTTPIGLDVVYPTVESSAIETSPNQVRYHGASENDYPWTDTIESPAAESPSASPTQKSSDDWRGSKPSIADPSSDGEANLLEGAINAA